MRTFMRPVYTGAVLLAVLAAPACDDGGGGVPPVREADFGPTAAYNRRFMFLAPGNGSLPTAAVFDFSTLSDSIGIRRGARARLGDGEDWQPLLDAGWEMEPMREPWRLVPHGVLKMVVGETGELSALVVRDSATARLELGETLAEHSPDVGTQLVLRAASLHRAGRTTDGMVLDAQLGRAVNPALAVRDAAPRTNADAAGGDPARVSPTPIALPGADALLLGDPEYYAVLATASSGSFAWIRNGGRGEVRSGARLEPAAWSDPEEYSVQVPTAWHIFAPDGELNGELTARATDRVVLRGTGTLEALAYVLVTGWVEDREARRDVSGLVRHVR
jgi:hypothetical protein